MIKNFISGKGVGKTKRLRIALFLFTLVTLGILLSYLASILPMFGRAATPGVATNSATAVTLSGATLNGNLESTQPGNPVTVRGFEYGTTTSYGQTVDESTSPDYVYKSQWGQEGGNDGQFSVPVAIAVDSAGNKYVTDYGNNRIQKFSSSGVYVSQFGGAGTGDGQFSGPKGIATSPDSHVYVVDTGNDRIQKFTASGAYVSQFGGAGTGDGQFLYATGIAIAADGSVYVTDLGNDRIQKFTASGAYVSQFGGAGTGDGQFAGAPGSNYDDGPVGIGIDPDGNVFVSDANSEACRIQKFTANGVYVSQFGTCGGGEGEFYYPTAVAVDSQGAVYAYDQSDPRIQKFTNDGEYLTQFGGYGTGDGQLDIAEGIAVDSYGRVFVADQSNNRIQEFTAGFVPGAYSLDVTGLSCNTTYHYRSFATNSDGTANGDDNTFTTSSCSGEPAVQTNAADTIEVTSALVKGTLNDMGASSVTSWGFDYGTTSSYGIFENAPPPIQLGAFNLSVDELTCNTTYHFRAVATNDEGTDYGDDMTFTTDACAETALAVSTDTATEINRTSVNLKGTVTSGAGTTTTKGFRIGATLSYGQTFAEESTQDIAYAGQWGGTGTGAGQLSEPRNSAVDSDDNVYVVDSRNDRVQKFAPNGTYISQLGGPGTGDGQFRGPDGIAIDDSGNIYISDSVDNRIQKFDSSGAFLGAWGSYGTGNGQFQQPSDIAIDSLNNVYVNDTNNQRIQKFDSSGTFITAWGDNGSGQGDFHRVTGMAFDSNDVLFVADGGHGVPSDNTNNRVQRFTTAGVWLGDLNHTGSFHSDWAHDHFGSNGGEFTELSGITIDAQNNIYTVESGNNRIQMFNNLGVFLKQWGSQGTGNTQFDSPQGVSISPSGSMYVSDLNNDRIVKYQAFQTGSIVQSIDALTCDTTYHYQAFASNETETAYGQDRTFTTPACMPVPTATTEAATDVASTSGTFNGTVTSQQSTMTQQGFRYGTTTSYGQSVSNQVSQFAYVGEVDLGGGYYSELDNNGNIFSSDQYADEIVKHDSDGTLLATFGSTGAGDGQFNGPSNIAVDSIGDVYVIDYYNSRIQKFDNDGNYLLQFGTYGTGDDQLLSPSDIAVDSSNNVYVLDGAFGRIQKFSSSGVYISSWRPVDNNSNYSESYFAMNIDSSDNVYLVFNEPSTLVSGEQSTIQKFTIDGYYLGSVGSSGTGNGQLSYVTDVSFDSQDNVYVADLGNQRIQKFDPNGDYLSGTDTADYPLGIMVDAAANVYTTIGGSEDLEKYSPIEQPSTYTMAVSNLSCGTTYHYQAFATNPAGTGYGNDSTFSTTGCLPAVTTNSATDLLPASATLNGTLQSLGTGAISSKGFQYGLTTSYGLTSSDSVSQSGDFSRGVSSLTCNSTYHYRAFATNATGTVYGSDMSFTTPVCLPAVTTLAATSIGQSNGTLNGTIDTDTSSITDKGFRYGTDTNYGKTISQPIAQGPGYVQASSTLAASADNLTCDTTYHFQAFATNSGGTSYGQDRTFTTAACPAPPSVTTLEADTVSADSAVVYGRATDERNNITSRGIRYGTTTSYGSEVGDETIPPLAYGGQWGSQGTEQGQFDGPEAISVDADDNIYVVDRGGRIQKFDSNGVYRTSIGLGANGASLLNAPMAIAFDATGSMFIADWGSSRVLKFSSTGAFMSSFGSYGTGEGQFIGVKDIKIDSSGNMYVLDTYNYRVQKFTSSGTYISEWGSQGTGDGQFSYPQGIALDSEANVFVSDASSDRVQKFTNTGTYIQTIGSSGILDGQFSSPRQIAIDASDSLYVADAYNHRIQKFDNFGNFVTSIGAQGGGNGEFSYPAGVGVNSVGAVFVADTENHRIQKFATFTESSDFEQALTNLQCSTLYHYQAFATNNVGEGRGEDATFVTEACPNAPEVTTDAAEQINQTNAVLKGTLLTQNDTVTEQGFVYGPTTGYGQTISEQTNDRLAYAGRWTGGGVNCWDAGLSQQSSALVTDASGNMYASTCGSVMKYSSSGSLLQQIGSFGTGNGQFRSAEGIAFDSLGNIFVADSSNNRIQKFNSSGTYVSQWGTYGSANGQFAAPSGIAIDQSGNIYVADTYNNRIQKFNSSGTYVSKWDTQGPEPTDILYAQDGNLLVATTYGIKEFTTSGVLVSAWNVYAPSKIAQGTDGTVYVVAWAEISAFTSEGASLGLLTSTTLTPEGMSFTYNAITVGASGDLFVSDLNSGKIYRYQILPSAQTTDPVMFDLSVAGLSCETTYHYRAFATNPEGTGYGIDRSFVTPDCGEPSIPTVVTEPATSITENSAVYNGMISAGNRGVVNKGFNYGTTTSYGQTHTDISLVTPAYAGVVGDVVSNAPAGQSTNNTVFDSNDNMFVLDSTDGTVTKYNSSGTQTEQWGSVGSNDGQFSSPLCIEVDSSDNLYVCDTGNNRIQKFSNSGTFITKWGGTGQVLGYLDSPIDLAIDSYGNVYVVDSSSYVNKYSNSGTFITKWGTDNSSDWPNYIDYSVGIVVDSNNNVLVHDGYDYRVVRFDSSGTYISEFYLRNDVGYLSIMQIDAQDNLVISGFGGWNDEDFVPRFTIVSPEGNILAHWAAPNLSNPEDHALPISGIAIDSEGAMYFGVKGAVQKYESILLQPQIAFLSESLTCDTTYHYQAFASNSLGTGYGDDETFITAECPSNGSLTVTTDGSTVLDASSANLQGTAVASGAVKMSQRGFRYGLTTSYGETVYDDLSNGIAYSGSWGVNNQPFFRLLGPNGGTVTDDDGNVYTTGIDSETIQKFDSDGILLQEWGRDDGSPLNGAGNLAIDNEGNILVAELFGGRVSKFTSEGEYLSQLGSSGSGNGQFDNPTAVAVDSLDNVYVTDSGNSRIQKFDSDGNYLSQWGSYGSGDGQFNHPYSIAIDSMDNIYVADTDNHRIQKFDSDGNYLGKTPATSEWGGDWRHVNFSPDQYYPGSIAIGPDDSLYVSGYFDDNTVTYASSTVVNIDSNLDYIGQINLGTEVAPTGNLMFVLSLAVSSTGEIYLHGSNRIQKYEPYDNNGPFNFDVTSLLCATTYHYQAYGIFSSGTSYGEDRTFRTSDCDPVLPTVVTQAAGSVTKSSGVLNGTVVSIGSSNLDARGFQYGSTTSYGQTVSNATSATGNYAATLSSLPCSTTYHYRAFATSSVGTVYGSDRSFTTGVCDAPPQVVITAPTNNQVFGAKTTSVDLASEAFSTTSEIERVEFYVDGAYYDTVTESPYVLTALGLAVGTHTLQVRAYDLLGLSADAALVVFYVQPPVGPVPGPGPTYTTPTTTSTGTLIPPIPTDTKSVPTSKLPSLQRYRAPAFVAQTRSFPELSFGEKLFSYIPWILIALLFITALTYARQAMKAYLLKRQIMQTRERYTRTLKATNDFLTLTEHFLNTPLAIMAGAVELASGQKQIPAAAAANISAKLAAFGKAVKDLLGSNQRLESTIQAKSSAAAFTAPNILKDKYIWIPSGVTFVCLILANILLLRLDLLSSSTVRTGVEAILFVLVFVFLVLSRRFKAAYEVEAQNEKKRLDAEAVLFEKRREFVASLAHVLEEHKTSLELAQGKFVSGDQARLFKNGLVMVEKLAQGLSLAHSMSEVRKERTVFNVYEFVEKQIAVVQKDAKAKGLRIQNGVSKHLGVKIHPQELQQLVGSLLENAVQFSKDGGTVSIKGGKQFGSSKITIADNGAGIDPAKLDGLFQPFSRATDTMQYDYNGAGLSLYIDKIVVASLGGNISLKSKLGQGTKVTVRLPAANKQDAKVAPDLITPTFLQDPTVDAYIYQG